MSNSDVARKSNLWKYLLGCGCFVVLLGAAGIGVFVYFASKAFTMDPAKAGKIANEIVQFQMPEGYQARMAFNIIGFKMAMIQPIQGDENRLQIVLAKFPQSVKFDREEMEKQVEQKMQQGGEKRGEVINSQTIPLQVAGETVQATRQVMQQKSGARQIQYTFFLKKPDGTVMVVYFGNEDSYDSKAADAFIGSIK